MRALYRTPEGTSFTSQEELDEQYDITATVSPVDHEWISRRKLDDSARAREDLECTLQIPYGPTLAERLDVFPGQPGALS